MSEEGKKISFGFSKLSKKTSIIGVNKVNKEEKVQFIDCVEEKNIKIRDEEIKEEKLLVIPLLNSKVIETNGNITRNSIDLGKINISEKVSSVEFSKTETCVVETLDSIAAKEILEEVNKSTTEEEPKIYAVPLTTNAPLGEKESSLEDYENIPVSDYGLAMLRGMGWCPGKGIGKNEQLVTSSAPVLRPKGMGLGADKVIKTTPNLSTNNDNEDLKLVKGGFVRIIAGAHKDSYGQIEGFDEESGRLFVKLSLKNLVVSFNEFMVQLVNKHDFTKNSKVINVRKYEEYKDKEIEINKSDERTNKSRTIKNNRPESNSPHQQETSGNSRIKSNISPERHNISKHKSSKKHSKKSHRFRSSSDDSPPRLRRSRSQSRERTSSSRSRNYDSNRDRRKRSRSRSPRRK